MKLKEQMIYTLISTFVMLIMIFILIIMPMYFSNDAKYARDNLEYLNSQLGKINTKNREVPIHDLSSTIKWPLPKTIKTLEIYSNAWTDFYIKAKSNSINGIDQYSPHDTLSNLYYTSDSRWVKTIYTSIQYDAGITGTPLTPDLLSEWNESNKGIRSNANQAIIDMQKDYMMSAIMASISYVVTYIVCVIVTFIYEKQKNNVSKNRTWI